MQLKQLLKNGVYRTLGEAATGAGVVDNGDARTLRVLMYHKINDQPENSVTVPVSLFDEQLAQLGELGYTAVSLDDVLAYYVEDAPLPDGAVLITFDDGYRDNLENAVPVLEKYGYPAVLFVPIGYLDGSRPLPHDEHLASRGILNRTLQWSNLAELDAAGVRVESHGIGHRPLADLEVDEAAREITLSKLRLEEALGRPVRAFAYVKGSEAHYRLVHLSLLKQAGYEVAFTSISGAERAADRSAAAPPLQRRAVPGAHVRARARRRLRPDRGQGHGGRHARAAVVQRRARHVVQVTDFELVTYGPEHREDYLRLLRGAWGEGAMTGYEFDWWFDGNPAGSLRSVAVVDGRVVGVAGHSLYRVVLEGEEAVASASVHAVTDPSARGRGIFVELERKHEREATEMGVACVLAFASAPTAPLFLGPARLDGDREAPRLGATDVGHRLQRFVCARRRRRGRRLAAITSSATATYLQWRYLDSPRGYELFSTVGGYGVVWPAKRHRGRTISVLADHVGVRGSPPRRPAPC